MKLISRNHLLRSFATAMLLVFGAVVIYLILSAQAIVGTWQGDITETIRRGWNDNDPQMFVKSASTTITFYWFGIYKSRDTAICDIITEQGGKKITYSGWSTGWFTFHGRQGAVHELYGQRFIDGRLTKMQMPTHVRIEFRDRLKITIIEDYGNYIQLRYNLTRPKIGRYTRSSLGLDTMMGRLGGLCSLTR